MPEVTVPIVTYSQHSLLVFKLCKPRFKSKISKQAESKMERIGVRRRGGYASAFNFRLMWAERNVYSFYTSNI